MFTRRDLRNFHGCTADEYTPPKPDGWWYMPKEEIPIEVAPPSDWGSRDANISMDMKWPPEGKRPCVEGDRTSADLEGVPIKAEAATPARRQKSLQFEEPSPQSFAITQSCWFWPQ